MQSVPLVLVAVVHLWGSECAQLNAATPDCLHTMKWLNYACSNARLNLFPVVLSDSKAAFHIRSRLLH